MTPLRAQLLAQEHAQGAHTEAHMICPACQAEDYRAFRTAERLRLAQVLETAAEGKSLSTAECLRRIAAEFREVDK